MTLKIIGAGYGRTGTMSTYEALNMLGFPCYHMAEIIGNKANRHHADFWLNVARSKPGSQHDWSKVYNEYSATVDNPGVCVWQELMEAYPDAKVLLTVHPKGGVAWYESTMETIYYSEKRWEFTVLRFFIPFARKLGEIAHTLVWGRSHNGTMGNRKDAVAEYHRHIVDVTAKVPKEKLLVFSVDQGWEPLCEFLGVDVPDVPFPKVNDRKATKRMNMGMTVLSYLLMTATLAGLAALTVLCSRIMG